jgi:hypothetical protein
LVRTLIVLIPLVVLLSRAFAQDGEVLRDHFRAEGGTDFQQHFSEDRGDGEIGYYNWGVSFNLDGLHDVFPLLWTNNRFPTRWDGGVENWAVEIRYRFTEVQNYGTNPMNIGSRSYDGQRCYWLRNWIN